MADDNPGSLEPMVVQMVKNLPTIQVDSCLIPGLGRSPGEGNGYPFQYSYLKKPMDRGTWWASPWGRKESDTTEQLTLVCSLMCYFSIIYLVMLSACFERSNIAFLAYTKLA